MLNYISRNNNSETNNAVIKFIYFILNAKGTTRLSGSHT